MDKKTRELILSILSVSFGTLFVLMSICTVILVINLHECQKRDAITEEYMIKHYEEHMVEQLNSCKQSFQPIALGDSIYFTKVGLVVVNLNKQTQ